MSNVEISGFPLAEEQPTLEDPQFELFKEWLDGAQSPGVTAIEGEILKSLGDADGDRASRRHKRYVSKQIDAARKGRGSEDFNQRVNALTKAYRQCIEQGMTPADALIQARELETRANRKKVMASIAAENPAPRVTKEDSLKAFNVKRAFLADNATTAIEEQIAYDRQTAELAVAEFGTIIGSGELTVDGSTVVSNEYHGVSHNILDSELFEDAMRRAQIIKELRDTGRSSEVESSQNAVSAALYEMNKALESHLGYAPSLAFGIESQDQDGLGERILWNIAGSSSAAEDVELEGLVDDRHFVPSQNPHLSVAEKEMRLDNEARRRTGIRKINMSEPLLPVRNTLAYPGFKDIAGPVFDEELENKILGIVFKITGEAALKPEMYDGQWYFKQAAEAIEAEDLTTASNRQALASGRNREGINPDGTFTEEQYVKLGYAIFIRSGAKLADMFRDVPKPHVVGFRVD